MMYQVEKIKFPSEENVLVGSLFKTSERSLSPGILFLHGAGTSSSARFDKWQIYLAERGYTSFIFDCRGVGESEGEFSDGGLNNRLIDSENALRMFMGLDGIDKENICVIGNSMSGHTAVRMTEKFPEIKALILAYAAAYGMEAEDKDLGPEFTKALRKERSWENSQAFTLLEKFTGQTLVVYGEHEDIIPKEIQKRYMEIAGKKGESHILKHAGHRMLLPSNEKEEKAMQELFEISKTFLDKTFNDE